MNANLLGAIIAWLAFIAFVAVYPERTAARVAFIIATFFTLFFIAHLIAYYRRRTT
jgi:hypothetical protein